MDANLNPASVVMHRIVLDPETWEGHLQIQEAAGRRGYTRPPFYQAGYDGQVFTMYPGKPIDVPPNIARFIIDNSYVWDRKYDARMGKKIPVQDSDSDRIPLVHMVAELTPQPLVVRESIKLAAYTCPFTGKEFETLEEYREHATKLQEKQVQALLAERAAKSTEAPKSKSAAARARQKELEADDGIQG